jgi:hypothetical protein
MVFFNKSLNLQWFVELKSRLVAGFYRVSTQGAGLKSIRFACELGTRLCALASKDHSRHGNV